MESRGAQKINNMKIAIIAKNSNVLPSPKDKTWAPGVVMWNEARALVKRNINVRVYCAKGSKVAGDVVDFDMPSFYDSAADTDETQKLVRLVYYSNVYQMKVIKHLKENPVDIIHLHDFRDYPFYKEANLNTPILVTIHGDFFLNFNDIPDALKADMNSIPVLAIGDVSQIPEGMNPPVAVIPNILELKRFKLIEKPKNRMLFTSRLIIEKGPDIAIKASHLAKVKLAMYGGIIGDSNWRNKINRLIKNNSEITYFGHLPHSKIEQAFNGKALLFPLRGAEGFPSVVIESMVSGTPVIAFAISGVRNLIKDGVNGFLVKPGDIKGMAKAIKKVDMIDRKKCREYTLKQFNELAISNKLIATFEKTIKEYNELYSRIDFPQFSLNPINN